MSENLCCLIYSNYSVRNYRVGMSLLNNNLNMKHIVYYDVFDAKNDTGTEDKAFFVWDFRHCVLSINTASSAACTIKVYWSIEETAPDFTSAASATNRYDTVKIIDLEDWTSIAWDTGIVYTWTDADRNFEININALSYVAIDITAISAWKVTARLQLTNNA